MSPSAFSAIALSLPGVQRATVLGSEAFQVQGVTFAVQGSPDPAFATLNLTPDVQALFLARSHLAFSSDHGGGGLRGVTRVRIAAVEEGDLREALDAARRKALGSMSALGPIRPVR